MSPHHVETSWCNNDVTPNNALYWWSGSTPTTWGFARASCSAATTRANYEAAEEIAAEETSEANSGASKPLFHNTPPCDNAGWDRSRTMRKSGLAQKQVNSPGYVPSLLRRQLWRLWSTDATFVRRPGCLSKKSVEDNCAVLSHCTRFLRSLAAASHKLMLAFQDGKKNILIKLQ